MSKIFEHILVPYNGTSGSENPSKKPFLWHHQLILKLLYLHA